MSLIPNVCELSGRLRMFTSMNAQIRAMQTWLQGRTCFTKGLFPSVVKSNYMSVLPPDINNTVFMKPAEVVVNVPPGGFKHLMGTVCP